MEKVKVNPSQMESLESMVVAYMVLSENRAGHTEDEKKKFLLKMDKIWDSMFEVVIKS
ncbi:hypothetical protein NVP1091O_33 [Vibrio phage 1.091.O._10N.286.52.B12]|nr:hypothetical protein NVP1091O_33 [Vibrio phage 1.091.O._10N.286.52.B12]